MLGFWSTRCTGRLNLLLCGVDYHDVISIEPGKRSGKPCIRGTRMIVTDVLEYLAGRI